jgi:hypothetical protein
MDERDFSKDVILNRHKLDIECEKHSGIYHYYCDNLSTAKNELDEEKDKLSFMESELEINLRRNPPEDFKVTESAIKAYLGSNKVLEKQRQKINEIKKTIYHFEAAVRAMDHKKSMIGHLVNLFAMKYYSEPKIGNEIDDKIRDKLRRK